MSPEPSSSASPASGDLSAAESNLGLALALIHRVLPQLDEPDRAGAVQSALRKAAGYLESARQAHALDTGIAVGSPTHTSVDSETVAVIAAAIAVLLGRPYKLVSVQPAVVPVPHFNAWALEGRTQIFMSHRIR